MMKKYLLALLLISSALYAQPVKYPSSYEWINVKTDIMNDGSSTIEAIDMKNIYRESNQIRYFWKKNYWNFIGTTQTNMTMFTFTKVDCQKKIWISTALQHFKDGNLIESKDSSNHSFPWNFFDFNDERDRRTYSIVCG